MSVVADATDLVVPFMIPLLGYIVVALFGFGLVNSSDKEAKRKAQS
jgi:FHS family L-fucose permease-like MFS transporter